MKNEERNGNMVRKDGIPKKGLYSECKQDKVFSTSPKTGTQRIL